jgi:putative multiple sugar transport system substrate-binding protein
MKGTTVKKHRILGAVAAAGVIALVATGCGRGGTAEPAATDGAQEPGGSGQIVGVAMPTQESERWIADGDNVKSQLEEMGYTVDLQYANNDIPTQVSQIENMVSSGAEALIIASIDGTTLTDVLAQAGDAGIPVIAMPVSIVSSIA